MSYILNVEKVKELHLGRGWTRQALADEADLPARTVGHALEGKPVSEYTVSKLAKALNSDEVKVKPTDIIREEVRRRPAKSNLSSVPPPVGRAEEGAKIDPSEPPPDPDPTAWRGAYRDSSQCRYVPLRPAAPFPGPLTLEKVGESVPACLTAVGRVRDDRAGHQVVALQDDGQVVVYDADLQPLARWPTSAFPHRFWHRSLGLIDTTGNGCRDICLAVPEPLEVRVYNGQGHLLGTLPPPPPERPWTHAAIMGVDDGHSGSTPRIFVRWEDFGQTSDIHRVLVAYEARWPGRVGPYARLWKQPWGALSMQGVAVGDLTGDGRRTEFVVNNYSPANGCAPVDGEVQGPDWHTFVLVLNDQGKPLFRPRSLSGVYADTSACVTDLNGDGRDEVLLLTSARGEMAQPYSALRVLQVSWDTRKGAWVGQETARREYRDLALTSLAVAPRTKTRPAWLLVSDQEGSLHVFDKQLHEIRSLLCGGSDLDIVAIGDFDADGSLEALVQEHTVPALLIVDDWDTGPATYHRVRGGSAGERLDQVVLTAPADEGELAVLAVVGRREAGETHHLHRWRFALATEAPVTPPEVPSLKCHDVTDERAHLRCGVAPRIHNVQAWAWSPCGTWRACVTGHGARGTGHGAQSAGHRAQSTLGTLGTSEGTSGTSECVLLDARGWPQHRFSVPRAELYHLRWSPSETRLALLGTPEEALRPTVLAVCDVEAGTVQTREVPGYVGLNLAWLPEKAALAVQLGRPGQDERGQPIIESAGLWRWTFATDGWEPLAVPGLSEAAYLLADGLEQGRYAFFDPATAALFMATLSGEFHTSVQSPEPSSLISHPSSLIPLFEPSQMTDLLNADDALRNPCGVRRAWLMDGDTLYFAVRPDQQARRISGAVAPDGRRLAVPLALRHLDAVDLHLRHYILHDLWLFAAGELPRQLTYRDDLNLRRPVWDPTGRFIAAEARRLDRFEPSTEVWVVRVADRQMFYIGLGEQPQWDPGQEGRHLAFLCDGTICYVAEQPKWFAGEDPR